MLSFGLSANLPASVRVRYQGKRCDGDASDMIPAYYVSTVNTSSVGSISLPGTTGTTEEFHDFACALFSVSGGDPSNKVALDALTLIIATDFLSWRTINYDLVINGIANLNIDATIDEISWFYGSYLIKSDLIFNLSEQSPNSKPGTFLPEAWTRLHSAPPGGEHEELSHFDPAEAACTETQTPCIEIFSPLATAAAGGITNLPKVSLCLIDGRLQADFTTTDKYHCRCSSSSSKSTSSSSSGEIIDCCPGVKFPSLLHLSDSIRTWDIEYQPQLGSPDTWFGCLEISSVNNVWNNLISGPRPCIGDLTSAGSIPVWIIFQPCIGQAVAYIPTCCANQHYVPPLGIMTSFWHCEDLILLPGRSSVDPTFNYIFGELDPLNRPITRFLQHDPFLFPLPSFSRICKPFQATWTTLTLNPTDFFCTVPTNCSSFSINPDKGRFSDFCSFYDFWPGALTWTVTA